MHYIGLARNNYELEAAISLAASIFRREEEKSQADERKLFLVSQSKKISKKDVVIISLGEMVLGACFLIDRKFYKGDGSIKGTFLSSICLDSSFRGRGLSESLINFSLDECKKRSSAFALVIARKAVDYYYLKFGFYGVASYSKVKIILKNNPKKIDFAMHVSRAEEKNISALNKIYKKTYSGLLGSCVRSPTLWRNIFNKASIFGMKVSVFSSQGNLVGYAIYSNSNVFEIACKNPSDYSALLSLIGDSLRSNELVLHLPPSHSALCDISDFDVTLSKRYCDYGGHMVKIIDKKKLILALKSEIEAKFKYMNLGPFSLNHNKFTINFDGNIATFSLSKFLSQSEKTRILMGAEILNLENHATFLLQLKPFDIPLMDQI